MKQSNGINGDLKPEYKKTTKRTTHSGLDHIHCLNVILQYLMQWLLTGMQWIPYLNYSSLWAE